MTKPIEYHTVLLRQPTPGRLPELVISENGEALKVIRLTIGQLTRLAVDAPRMRLERPLK